MGNTFFWELDEVQVPTTSLGVGGWVPSVAMAAQVWGIISAEIEHLCLFMCTHSRAQHGPVNSISTPTLSHCFQSHLRAWVLVFPMSPHPSVLPPGLMLHRCHSIFQILKEDARCCIMLFSGILFFETFLMRIRNKKHWFYLPENSLKIYCDSHSLRMSTAYLKRVQAMKSLDLDWVQGHLCHMLAVWTWADIWIPLSLSLLMYSMHIQIEPTWGRKCFVKSFPLSLAKRIRFCLGFEWQVLRVSEF